MSTAPVSVEPPPRNSERERLRVENAWKVHRNGRVFVFYSLAVLLTSIGSLLFADLLWRQGWSPLRTVLLVLFTILFLLASIGCMHGIYGFILRRVGEKRRITLMGDYQSRSIEGTSTALVFPVYNEDARRVFEGVRTTFESLKATGELERFDFFVLSDSTNPERWVEEERRWFELIRDLRALGRIFYRRRFINVDKKSGNIRDFLDNWGTRYRYFIVFDADSLMSGTTLVDLVKLMETHPDVGLIQTAPGLVNARSAFARMQQFASRMYGPIFTAGLNFWAQDGGNYWGHNAIIRTEPFMQYCDLPTLPGKKPFGGHILSHDFVEAALLGKENWQVWFAWDLEGSYEEGPPAIIDSAQRDRRWCQGNLQHFMVLFARGLRGISRVHLSMGIMGYLAGPLWFLFMLTGTYLLWYQKDTGLSEIVVEPFTPFLRLDSNGHALLVFGLSMTVIFIPKILSLIDLALDRDRLVKFGGFARASSSAFLETVFSTLHAPIQMLFHTKFVISALLGTSVHWATQQRASDGTAWSTALREHWGHTAFGFAWGAVVWHLDSAAFWWFVPVLLGMVLSVPVSVFTSREGFGQWLRESGLFLTPEETHPPKEIARLHDRLLTHSSEDVLPRPHSALQQVVLDPYANALHVSLLREKQMNPNYARVLSTVQLDTDNPRALGARLLKDGPSVLEDGEELRLMSDAETLSWLHHEAWRRSPEELHGWWHEAIAHYTR